MPLETALFHKQVFGRGAESVRDLLLEVVGPVIPDELQTELRRQAVAYRNAEPYVRRRMDPVEVIVHCIVQLQFNAVATADAVTGAAIYLFWGFYVMLFADLPEAGRLALDGLG